jgi:hypothetical protein
VELVSSDGRRIRCAHDDLAHALGAESRLLDDVLHALIANRLLTVDRDEQSDALRYELAHDYLLGEIQIDPEVLAQKAAQELLDQETAAYRRFGTLLDADKFRIVDSQRTGLRLSGDAADLLHRSQEVLETAERKRRLNSRLLVGAAALIATLIIAALVIAQIGSNQVIAEQNAAATRDAQAAATIILQATAEATARFGAESAATAEAVARVTAEWNAEVAEVEKVRADREAEVAIRQGNIALARQLAAQTHSVLDRGLSDELSLLLAVEAARAGCNAGAFVHADDALRRAFAVAPLVIIRHEDGVDAVVFSADSAYLATASWDGTARLVIVV